MSPAVLLMMCLLDTLYISVGKR